MSWCTRGVIQRAGHEPVQRGTSAPSTANMSTTEDWRKRCDTGLDKRAGSCSPYTRRCTHIVSSVAAQANVGVNATVVSGHNAVPDGSSQRHEDVDGIVRNGVNADIGDKVGLVKRHGDHGARIGQLGAARVDQVVDIGLEVQVGVGEPNVVRRDGGRVVDDAVEQGGGRLEGLAVGEDVGHLG